MKTEQKVYMRNGDGLGSGVVYLEGRINRDERERGIREDFHIYVGLADQVMDIVDYLSR